MKLHIPVLIATAVIAASTMTFSAGAESLPERYDLREVEGALPEIKSQGGVGSCWAFGALANAEVWLRLNGFGEYDFSERHMDGMAGWNFNDAYNNMGFGTRAYGNGGFQYMAISYLFSGVGPVNEADCPYVPTVYEGNDVGLYSDYKVKASGIMVKDMLITDSVSDRWSVSNTRTDYINQLKWDIYNYGAVPKAYYSNEDYYYGEDDKSYFEETFEQPNHAVALVGWDDNYPREKLTDINGATAYNDGAFIIRNSWGSDASENGYFYMSYDCCSLFRDDYAVISRMDYIDYDNIYSNCCTTEFVWNTTDIDEDNTDYTYQVFERTPNAQAVNEISLCLRGNSSYELYIIDNYKSEADLSRKKLVSSGDIDRTCIKTIEFDPIKLSGDYFAVELKVTSDDDTLSLLPMVYMNDWMGYLLNPQDYSECSYVSSDGKNWENSIDTMNATIAFMRVYTVNTGSTHTLSFTTNTGIEYVELYTSKDSFIPSNPDGSYTLENGTYSYSIEAAGYEIKEGKVTVSGADKTVKINLKKCPQIYTTDEIYGIKDDAKTYDMSLYYGYADETLAAISEVTVNDNKVGYTVKDKTLCLKRSDITGVKSGDTLLISVNYKNGTSSGFSVTAKNYSDDYRLKLAKMAIIDKIDTLTPSSDISTGYLEELVEKAIKKYGTKFDYYVELYRYLEAQGTNKGKYAYNIYISYGTASDTLYYQFEYEAKKTEPTLKKLSGWDAIIASQTIAKSIEDGSTAEITLGSDGVVPEAFWKKVMGTKAVVEFTTFYGDVWIVKCSDVKKAADMDFTVYDGTKFSIYADYYDVNAAAQIPFYIDDSVTVNAQLTTNIKYDVGMSGKYVMLADVVSLTRYSREPLGDCRYALYRSGDITFKNISAGSYCINLDNNSRAHFGDLDLTEENPDENDYKLLVKRIKSGYYDDIDNSSLEFLRADANEDGVIDENDLPAFKEYLKILPELAG